MDKGSGSFGSLAKALLPLGAVLALGLGSLAFDLTLSWRLPSDADYAEVAGALRARARPGDAVQLWPPWAERARLFVTGAPVLAEEDLATADYAGIERLWLLALPHVPHGGLEGARASLERRGAVRKGEGQGFGALWLEQWDLRAPPLVSWLLPVADEAHEVDYVARRCAHVVVGSTVRARGGGAALHLRAGIIGERAYDKERPAIGVQVTVDGAPLGTVTVPPTAPPASGWHALDVALTPAAGEREFAFAVSSSDASRPFCLSAWTTAR